MPIDVFTGAGESTRLFGALSIGAENGGPVAQAVSTGSAVIAIPAGQSEVRLSAGAATTGASLPVGTVNGQLLFITITSAAANTVTFAAAGTSNVAGGAATSLAGLATHLLRWDAISALWYQVGPLAN